MGVFSDDFAAVDVREELCYHSRPKKQIREVIFASIFRNNRARKRIRTPIKYQGSYAHRLAQRGIFFGCASKASSAETGVCSFVRRAAPPPTSHFVLVRHGKKCNCKQAFFAHVGRANLRENGFSHLSSLDELSN